MKFIATSATLRRYLTKRNCYPGILDEVLLYLKKVQYSYLKNVSLVFDAMAIRSCISYDSKRDRNVGYVDLGGIETPDNEELASEALFFQIVSYSTPFKCPVAYFLIKKMNADVQTQLTLSVIRKLHEVGVNVRSITCDGTSTNLSTFTKLGCILNIENMKTNFVHPCDESIRIHCIMDPCHMLKLCRNTLADFDLKYNGEIISWKYIKKLFELQNEINFRFANSLSKSHIDYRNRKMKVKPAAQTISSGVADALQFLLNESDINFEGCAATIDFLRVFDRLFDLMNSRLKFGHGFKSPMFLNNQSLWEEIFNTSANYIRNLECQDHSTLFHKRKTFALGILIDTYSFRNLAFDVNCS